MTKPTDDVRTIEAMGIDYENSPIFRKPLEIGS
jgi:hypothetical protein